MIVERIPAKTNRSGFTAKCRCDNCGKTYIRKYILVKNLAHHFCSRKCYGEWKIENSKGVNNPFYNRSHTLETIEKIRKKQKGSNNKGWKGGKTTRHGYIVVKAYNHPQRDANNYIREHRLVMEKFLGRYLKPEEIVHHINGIKDDNRIENLMLFANNVEHIKYHSLLKEQAV
jgi:uncharacterized protein (DUF1330 family)